MNVGRNSILKYLRSEAKINLLVQEELNDASLVAGITEVWSDEDTCSYPALTVYFIDSKLQLRSHLLASEKLHRRHTGKALAETLIETAKSF